MRDWEWYPASKPIEVKGGIRAQSKQGSFAKKWWGRRWLQILESFNIGSRLQRGRSYARKGQVRDLKIEKGRVRAQVQGSRSGAYAVSIGIKPLSILQWAKVIESLLEQPFYAAQLLNNDMPEGIEEIFKNAGAPLFPDKKGDLSTDCSCPDWSNPCKHIAAVYYLMAEVFDNDPFLLLRMRGMDRENLLQELRDQVSQTEEPSVEQKPQALPLDSGSFWKTMPLEKEIPQESSPNKIRVHAALPKRLGQLGFWRGRENLLSCMDKLYTSASMQEEES